MNNLLSQAREMCSESFTPLDFTQTPPKFSKELHGTMHQPEADEEPLPSNDLFVQYLESFLQNLIRTVCKQRLFFYRPLPARQYLYGNPTDEQQQGYFSEDIPEQPLLSNYLDSQAKLILKLMQPNPEVQIRSLPQVKEIQDCRGTADGLEYFVSFKYTLEEQWISEERLRENGYGLLLDEFDYGRTESSE